MKLVDLQLNIDSLILDDEEVVDDFILKIEKCIEWGGYGITYEILYEEEF